jgi:hypothetical protein
MVQHKCIKCLKIFEKKSHLDQHNNKKNPCVIMLDITTQTPANILQTPANILQNPANILQNPANIIQSPANITEKNIKKYSCNFCYKEFSRSDNLKIHLINRCKIRKEEMKEKEEIFQKLLEAHKEETKNMIQEKDNKIDYLTKEIELLKQNKKTNKKTNNSNINNGSIINGTVNNNNNTVNNINIVQHGKEDLSIIDNEVLINAFLKHSGIKISEKMVEGIHFNDKYPEFKNIYMSDKNREKMMLHDGQKWVLSHSEEITANLLNKTIIFSETRYEAIKEKIETKLGPKAKAKFEKGLYVMKIMKADDDDIDDKYYENDEHYETDEEGKQLAKSEITRGKGLWIKTIKNVNLMLYNNRESNKNTKK